MLRQVSRRLLAIRSLSAPPTTTAMSIREGMNRALDEEMNRDNKVFLLGEEVAEYDGAYKISKSLWTKHGSDRVIDTPITEMGFTGMAIGAALKGMRPIVEFMSFNFSMQAIDQIVNSAAKLRYMANGDISVPIVFRGANGPAHALGATHMQCFAAWYSSIPGLKVLAPCTTTDYRGLFKSAVRDPDPVIFLENEMMYSLEFPTLDTTLDPEFTIPIGKAHIEKAGTDISIVSFGRGLYKTLQALPLLEELGINAEIVNLRTLKPLDFSTVEQSVMKTGHCVTVEESYPQSGVGSEICARIMEGPAFDFLDAPVERVTNADVPAPYAYNLEENALVSPELVAETCVRVLGKKR